MGIMAGAELLAELDKCDRHLGRLVDALEHSRTMRTTRARALASQFQSRVVSSFSNSLYVTANGDKAGFELEKKLDERCPVCFGLS